MTLRRLHRAAQRVGGTRTTRRAFAGALAALTVAAGTVAFSATRTTAAPEPGPAPDRLRAGAFDRRGQRPAASTFDSLRAKARAQGSVKVMVGLPTTFDPVDVREFGSRDRLRQRIGDARKPLLDRLGTRRSRVTHTYDLIPSVALDADEATLNELQASGAVATIEEQQAMFPTLADVTTTLVDSATPAMHGFDGTGQTVVVLDTGVETNHPFLTGRITNEACFSSSGHCPGGRTVETGAGSAAPCTYDAGRCAHGTQVAGVAVGRRAAGGTFDGVAPGARLMPINVFSRATGTACAPTAPSTTVCALSYTADQLRAMEFVLGLHNSGTRNIAAVNLSVGSDDTHTAACDGSTLKPGIDALRAVGIPTILPSGNRRSSTGVSSPGCISTAITVGNSTKADAVFGSSNSSNQVELLAPGTNIRTSTTGGGMVTATGTSLSAPAVAGAWAIYRQRYNTDIATTLAQFRATGLDITDARNSVTVPRIRLSHAMRRWAFVWADQPTAGSYIPSTSYSGNSQNQPNAITRLGTGNYRVDLTLQGGPVVGGNVLVSAYGSTAARCKVARWTTSGLFLQAFVLCSNMSGTASDTTFTLSYQSSEIGDLNRDEGYVWASSPTTASYTPLMGYQTNSRRNTNTVRRLSTGSYEVTFPGFSTAGGHRQVTAYGTGGNYCKVRSWTATTATVDCYAPNGTKADTPFTLDRRDRSVPSGRRGGYVHADNATSTSWYSPSSANRWSSTGGTIQARKTSTGNYEVRFPNMPGSNDTTALVTAVGTSDASCWPLSWGPNGTSALVSVRCANASGTAVDSQFNVLYYSNIT